MVHEIIIGLVLGATARVTMSALTVAGSVIAQQLGLGFVTAVDPTQGQQGVVDRQLPDHPRDHAAVRHRHASSGDRGADRQLQDLHAGRTDVRAATSPRSPPRPSRTAFKIGVQLSAPFLVFGLVFNLGLGVLARLMPQMQVYFVGVPLSILLGFLILVAGHRDA